MDKKTKVYELGLNSVIERNLGLFDRNRLKPQYIRGNPVQYEELAQSRLKKSIVLCGVALSILVCSVVLEQLNLDFKQLEGFASTAMESESIQAFKDLIAKHFGGRGSFLR
ncbi:MAG: hypothetical protein HRU09_14235 [Oligoflexales bacterium]|nr:hypothetical protein [Oligoflexales bacterium]